MIDLPPTDWPIAFDGHFEEFRTAGLGQMGQWQTVFPWGGRTIPPNHELEIYVDPSWRDHDGHLTEASPFSVRDGVLTITARPIPADEQKRYDGHSYTSGLITTYNSFRQTYGYFEMRASYAGDWVTTV